MTDLELDELVDRVAERLDADLPAELPSTRRTVTWSWSAGLFGCTVTTTTEVRGDAS